MRRSPGSHVARLLSGTVLLAAMLAAACEAQPRRAMPFTEKDAAQTRAPSDSFRMALAQDSIRRVRVIDRMRGVATHFAQLPWEIPEYHDEQAFPVSSDRLGPMAYAFGSPYLDGFRHVNQVNAHGDFGMLAAVVWVEEAPGSTLPAPYAALNLVGGLNCVYVAHRGPNVNTNWRAFILPGSEATGCKRPTAATPALAVRFVRHPLHGAQDDYPAVARFGETSTGAPTIGARCLNGWCVIGPSSGFTPRPPSHSGDAKLRLVREGRVAPWHDDQRLTLWDPALGRLKPGPRATVVPIRDLETLALADFTDVWLTVATIWLGDNPAGTKYADKWGMAKGRNLLQLSWSGGQWHARVAPDRSPTNYTRLHVEQHKHFDMVVPGTARFRWRNVDDGVWVSCDQGCCRVDAYESDGT